MKRLLFVLSALVVVTSLCACGGSARKTNVWDNYDDNDSAYIPPSGGVYRSRDLCETGEVSIGCD